MITTAPPTTGSITLQAQSTPKRPTGKAHYGATADQWSWFADTANDGLGLGLQKHLIPITANPHIHHPAIPARSRGKVPSTYEGGRVVLMDAWQLSRATADDIGRWSSQPDLSFGVQCCALRAFDVDVTDPALARDVETTIIETLGFTLPRRGRADSSKFLLAFTSTGTVSKGVLQFKGYPGQKIELLGDGQQFVAAGTHTDGFPYVWTPQYPPLVPLSSEQLESVKAVLAQRFGEWRSPGSRRSRGDKVTAAIASDPVVSFLREHGHVRSETDEGKLIITCPFADEHTTGGGEAAYFPRFTKGYERGHFHCLHTTVTHKDAEFLAAIGFSSDQITIDDFWCYLPASNQFIFTPTGAMWPGMSVDARLPPIPLAPATYDGEDGEGAKPAQHANGQSGDAPKKNKKTHAAASEYIRWKRRVDQMVWTPGEAQVIVDRLASDGGWISRTGTTCFNLYRPPIPTHGDPDKAGRWVDLVCTVFGTDAEHIIRWLAHRVQRPGDKINHALVLGGSQGIGKDTILEPVKQAIGPWNFAEASPGILLGQFNPFIKSVILRVSEARDLGGSNRFDFYDHMKTYTAAPPDVLPCNEKHLKPYSVFNVTGVIITSNHKIDGIFLPADDRRHFVAWSELTKEDFSPDYWTGLWAWYKEGGKWHVAAYLQTLDLADFDAKAPPIKTTAFWAIVDANRAPEDAELADTIDKLKNPPVLTLDDLEQAADHGLKAWLGDRKNRRIIPHRLEAAGYVVVRNDAAKDRLWKVAGRRQAFYGKRELSTPDNFAAIEAKIKCAGPRTIATDFDGDGLD